MKLKHILTALIALSMISTLSACDVKNENDNDSIITETVAVEKEADQKSETEPETSQITNNETVTIDKEIDNEIKTEVKDETKQNNGNETDYYSNKLYIVGDDIPEAGYNINCTATEYGLNIIVFSSEENYNNFQNADKISYGEFRTAVETNAWADFYLETNENAYIKLKKGNLILIDNGKCEFNKYNPSDSNILYPGIYIVGEDVNCGHTDIKCTSDYMKVTLFKNKDKFSEYHKSSRFTIGEESDAIDKYSESSDFIYNDSTTSLHMENGMILMIEEGFGELSIDNGPIIN